ncbi:hypothetical protein HKD37_09G025438 [Glycine soja]
MPALRDEGIDIEGEHALEGLELADAEGGGERDVGGEQSGERGKKEAESWESEAETERHLSSMAESLTNPPSQNPPQAVVIAIAGKTPNPFSLSSSSLITLQPVVSSSPYPKTSSSCDCRKPATTLLHEFVFVTSSI